MGTLIKNRENLFPSIPLFFDDFFTKDFFSHVNESNTLPAVNIHEKEDKFILELAAPGMSKEDFMLEVNNNNLTITAQRKSQSERNDKTGNYTLKEFNYQHFSRSFKLPESKIVLDKISAKYDNGILNIDIPKQVKALSDSSRRIEIS